MPRNPVYEFMNEELPLEDLTFSKLRKVNVSRCETVFHPIAAWTPAEWAVAMAGECGEACNAVKKLADLIIYADLLAARLGIDLGVAVSDKFNRVSALRGATERL